ncbi:MAG: hypothetical protein HY820_37100 [Acidobacteria bacterium]|nr:hypothetical protein [Acidobacteriota bacterium]
MKGTLDSCPRPDLLVALEEGVLPETLATPVRSHLEHCHLCTHLRDDLIDAAFAEPTLAETAAVRQRVFGPRRPNPAFRWAGVVAAAAALIFVLVHWQSAEKPGPQVARQTSTRAEEARPKPPYRLTLEPAPLRLPFAAVVIRGSSAALSASYLKELGGALDPYRAGNFDESSQRMAALRQKYPQAVEPAFYQGVSELLRNDAGHAMEPLQAARKIGGEALNDDIDWYLAIAHERNGNWSSAEPLLAKLCKSEGHYRNSACAATPK